MSLTKRLILAFALMAGLSPAFAQAPPPVPALPDTERRTSYSISGTTCACAVNFALYGDSTDYGNWLEVWLNGVLQSSATYTITSPTGPLASIPRPVTDAVLTFNTVQTGTVQIVGARRPRRVSQFTEGRGVAARDLNQVLTDIIAQNRETWDKTNDVTGRAILAPGGETLSVLPPASSRANKCFNFDSSGQPLPVGCTTQGLTPNSFDQIFCNTVGFLIVRFTGAWACSKGIAANPVWFGADPTGSADSTSAFNSALAASTQIEFPPGKFKFLSAITYNIPAGINSVTIKGAGQDNTILFWPSAGGITINYSGIGHSAHIRDLSFTTGTTTGGSALALNNSSSDANPADTATSDVYSVTIRGDDGYELTDFWPNALNVVNVSNTQVENLTVIGAAGGHGNGINIVGLPASSTYAVALNVAKSNFVGLGAGLIYGSFVQGVTVDQSNFTGDLYGIISLGSQTGVLEQLSVTNSQFNASSAAINANTQIGAALITNDLFLLAANAIGIQMPATVMTLSSNQILATSTTGTTGINLTGTSGGGGVISSNFIQGCGTGINISAGTSIVSITANQFTGNTTNLVNAGSNIRIENNQGYNPVGPTGITVTASPFTYTAGSSPETVYVWGGTVSSVQFDKNGGALTTVACNTTPCTVDLGPFEQAKVTYTGIPNMNKMIH